MPPIRAELDLSPDMIDIIGALPLISFILATLVAPLAASSIRINKPTSCLALSHAAADMPAVSYRSSG